MIRTNYKKAIVGAILCLVGNGLTVPAKATKQRDGKSEKKRVKKKKSDKKKGDHRVKSSDGDSAGTGQSEGKAAKRERPKLRRRKPMPLDKVETIVAAESPAEGTGDNKQNETTVEKQVPQTTIQAAKTVVRAKLKYIKERLINPKTSKPGLVLFLVDTSATTAYELQSGEQVASMISRGVDSSIKDLIDSNTDENGKIHGRYDVASLAYSDNVVSLLGSRDIVSLDELDEMAGTSARKDGSKLVRTKTWTRFRPYGGTAMNQGFSHLVEIYKGWKDFGKKRLILAVHVTDGEYEDKNPAESIRELDKTVRDAGGQLILTNIHVSPDVDKELYFPTRKEVEATGSSHALDLYLNSSPIPKEVGKKMRINKWEDRRMFALNVSNPTDFISVLKAGSSLVGNKK